MITPPFCSFFNCFTLTFLKLELPDLLPLNLFNSFLICLASAFRRVFLLTRPKANFFLSSTSFLPASLICLVLCFDLMFKVFLIALSSVFLPLADVFLVSLLAATFLPPPALAEAVFLAPPAAAFLTYADFFAAFLGAL